MHRRHAAWAVVTVRAVRGEEFDVTLGRVRGRVRALLTVLERAGATDAHAWPRPFETASGLARFAIGLGRAPLDAAELDAVAGPWAAGLRGADVAWAGAARFRRCADRGRTHVTCDIRFPAGTGRGSRDPLRHTGDGEVE
nr:hypothetical protein GCM10020093_016470 [Planobispora longispora]